MMNAAQAVDGGAGVLFIVKNYSGDMMNFQMASEMLDQENAVVVVNDDVAVEDSTYTTGRRGVAGAGPEQGERGGGRGQGRSARARGGGARGQDPLAQRVVSPARQQAGLPGKPVGGGDGGAGSVRVR
jgi:hypothetical protein